MLELHVRIPLDDAVRMMAQDLAQFHVELIEILLDVGSDDGNKLQIVKVE